MIHAALSSRRGRWAGRSSYQKLNVIERPNHSEIPSLPYGASLLDDGIHEVVARDTAGYFGSRIDDVAFVREYEAIVPEARYWLFDARLSPGWTVRK